MRAESNPAPPSGIVVVGETGVRAVDGVGDDTDPFVVVPLVAPFIERPLPFGALPLRALSGRGIETKEGEVVVDVDDDDDAFALLLLPALLPFE